VRSAVSDGRLVLVTDDGLVDVAASSGGLFSADPMAAFSRWSELVDWAGSLDPATAVLADGEIDGPCVPRPSQVFGVGLNYRLHALESGLPIPDTPLVFTKFPSSIAPPVGEVVLFTEQVDWEVEMAVVVAERVRNVHRADAWRAVAGLTVAQDFSARDVQMTPAGSPQFSLGKSFAGFLPLGPVLATTDEFEDASDIGLWCEIDGVRVQDGRTDDLVFPVPVLIEYLSSVVELQPGDVILTGTPSGVGLGMSPQRFLQPGELVVTGMDVVGRMSHRAVAPPTRWRWSA
jgi:2-keto-4-pentenoate hydratase/2-oxohepta-3-ene-1,7-dioic acid hydratase in catechol pathway